MTDNPFVMIHRQVLDSKAYRTMSMGARTLYTALRRRYWKDRHNNGRIYLSQRDASKELNRDTNQITRWFRELQHFGFIVQTKGGSLGTDGVGRAPHWRLTELGYMKEKPTEDFLRWDGTPFRDAPTPKMRTMAFCKGCGVEFRSKRKDAQFCSHSCRQRVFRERDGKQNPVRENTDTYVREIADRGVRENTDGVTDKRPLKSGHTERETVREIGDISSIPSSGSGKLRWTTPALTEITAQSMRTVAKDADGSGSVYEPGGLVAGTALHTDPLAQSNNYEC
jgi:hypothetical protein